MPKQDKKVNTIKRIIDVESDVYNDINKFSTDENDRMGLVSRSEKIHFVQALHILVKHGINFRNHQVYLPEDKKGIFMKDEKFSKLLAKAQVAMDELKDYQEKLLAR